MNIHNNSENLSRKCSVKNCAHPPFDNHENCILHCDKSEWNNENDEIFWDRIRADMQDEHDFFMFVNIIFPSFINNRPYPQGFNNGDFILEDDYLFWKAGNKKSFKSLAQFTNCTFYNFDFFYIKAQTLNFTDCIVKGKITFFLMSIENIFIVGSKEINELRIDTNNLKKLSLSNFISNKIEMKSLKVNSITLSKLNIHTVVFNELFINNGKFEDLHVNTVAENATLFIDDTKKFFYQNVVVKNADREYFRFLKKLFTEKDDFINANEMYRCEMESYYKEILQQLKLRKNIVNNLQNLIVAGFAKWTSNFGESWLRPLGLLLITLFLNISITKGYSLHYLLCCLWNIDGDFWNEMIKSMYFFEKESFTLTKLLFNILQGLLIYQIVVSIKRKIKY